MTVVSTKSAAAIDVFMCVQSDDAKTVSFTRHRGSVLVLCVDAVFPVKVVGVLDPWHCTVHCPFCHLLRMGASRWDVM